MGSNRMDKVNSQMRELLASILFRVKDPRLSTMLTVREVVTSKDLRCARIYVSLMGTKKEKEENMLALESAKGYIRKELGAGLTIKFTPELQFFWDDSIERGTRINRIIKKITEI